MIAYGLEQTKRSSPHDVGCVFRLLKRYFNVALRAKIINFIRLYSFKNTPQPGPVRQVTIM